MLVKWKEEAVLPFQEATPVAFRKLMRGVAVASSQFISIKVVFSVRANGSEKLLFDRKVQYKKGTTRKSLCNPSFRLCYNPRNFIWVSCFISAVLPVSDTSICFYR